MKKILLLLCFLLIGTLTYANDDMVQPFVNYITNNGNGTYSITYGYNSTYSTTKNFPVATSGNNKNYFGTNPADRGQVTTFLPGIHNEAFSITVPYGTFIVWNVTSGWVLNGGTKNITCSVTNNAGETMPGVGNQVTYTLSYNNTDWASLTNTQLIDTLGPGVTFVSCTGGGVHNNGVVTWPIGTLGSNVSGSKTVTVQVSSFVSNYRNAGCISGTASGTNYRGTGTRVNVASVPSIADSSYIVAFEDLKNSGWNDWDVNDFVVGMRERQTFNASNGITKIVFDYEALARGSAFVNKFHHLIKLSGNSTATLVVKDSNGTVLPALGFTNQAFTGNIDVPIFPNTYNALPPRTGAFSNTEIAQVGVVKGYTATLTINTDAALNTSSNYLRNSSLPYLINELNKQINIASLAGTLGNTQNVDNIGNESAALYGYFLDLGYRLPYDWKWPLEIVAVWNSFPQFEEYILSSHSSNTAWYNSPDLNKVWTRRVVTDNFPFTGHESNSVSANNTKKSDYKKGVIKEHSLSQNYPNPFNPTTKISFSLPKGEFVTVKIFDMSGKEVAQLVNGEMNAGTHEYQFDGSKLSSGIYFYRINTASFTDTKRMILVK